MRGNEEVRCCTNSVRQPNDEDSKPLYPLGADMMLCTFHPGRRWDYQYNASTRHAIESTSNHDIPNALGPRAARNPPDPK
eukprot:912678-Pelagomonas_calceolata.AAC.1